MGFDEPERTDNGLIDHRPGLHISIEYWAWKNEAGFTTTVHGFDPDGQQRRACWDACVWRAASARCKPFRRALALEHST